MNILFPLLFISCSEVDSSTVSVELFQSEVEDNQITRVHISSEIDGYNNPNLILGEAFERNFRSLPTDGSLGEEPWSDTYWPKNKGGISHRWRTDESHTYELHTKEELILGGVGLVENLSPAEKYDLLVGNYDWSLTHREMASGNPNEASWAGLCHGWSPASLAYDEPHPVVLENPDGIRIPFGSSDIKALLSYFRGEVIRSDYPEHDWRSQTMVLGSQCGSEKAFDPACYDTNPAAFHLVMANQLGIRGEGFNIDADTLYQKWNQPVFEYHSRVLRTDSPSASSSEGSVQKYIIESNISWGLEIEPSYLPVLNTSHQATKNETFYYSLDVDAQGDVIGGQWLTKTEDNGFISLNDAWDILSKRDEDNNGIPDFDEIEVSKIIWQYFSFPDYVWIQTNADFPQEYKPLSSKYTLISTTRTSRQELFDYFGMLEELYEKSVE